MLNRLRSAPFFQLPRNTRVTILAQPLWAIPAGLVMPFASLYMMRLSLSSQQIGLISSLSTLATAIAALFAGWLIDTMGRKRALLCFDTLTWIIPYFFWATASSFEGFLLAGLLHGPVIINSIVYECYHVEDVPLPMRMTSLRYQTIVSSLYGFMPLGMGLLINRYSFIPAMRGCYWLGLVCSLLFVGTKWLFLRDTEIGLAKRRQSAGGGFSLADMLRRNVDAIRYVLRNRDLAILYLIEILMLFASAVVALFLMPSLSALLRVSDAIISLHPILTTSVSFLTTLGIMPRIPVRRHAAMLGGALVALCCGTFCLAIARFGGMYPLLALQVLCGGFASSCTAVLLQARIQNSLTDDMRSNVMSAFQLTSMLIRLPTGVLGGLLYASSPQAPFALSCVVYACAAALYWRFARRGAGVHVDAMLPL